MSKKATPIDKIRSAFSESDPILICDARGVIAKIPNNLVLKAAAMRWSYTVRNRARWRSTKQSESLAAHALKELSQWVDLSTEGLNRLASSDRIEVKITFREEGEGWAARLMPWEYVISSAVQAHRGDGRSPAVFRQLNIEGHRQEARQKKSPSSLLFVCCNPGSIGEHYSFENEFELIDNTFMRCSTIESGLRADILNNPSLDELREKVVEMQPAIIHVAGVDNYEGFRDFGVAKPEQDGRHIDGIVMRSSSGTPEAVLYTDIASALCAADQKPMLVTFNAYNTGARVSAMTVAKGAKAAVGFQDTIDDHFAEQFYAAFFAAWLQINNDMVAAFEFAWKEARQHADTAKGLGILLWNRFPQLAERTSTQQSTELSLSEKLSEQRKHEKNYDSVEDANKALRIEVKPLERLNYSLLHNHQPLFKSFTITHLNSGMFKGLQVSVKVHAGSEELTFAGSFDIHESPLDLSRLIHVPLTSVLFRTLKESIRTTLSVELKLPNGQTIWHRSHFVSLLAFNEWVDDDENRHWLPSFVFPLDPAVVEIIERAQAFIGAITDDPAAGFDGYQSVGYDEQDPTLCVDHQVAAIWSSLLDRLGYINPPPTYNLFSQRVRTPSDVIGGGRGTCIDLTLLLAACMEYIGIYPVIFLMQGHAYPGYWRSEESWQNFRGLKYLSDIGDKENVNPEDLEDLEDLEERARVPSDELSWKIESNLYPELFEQIKQGNLVPLESVMLTTRDSFSTAQNEGWENFLSRKEFDCMIDIMAARYEPDTEDSAKPTKSSNLAKAVTPLPLPVSVLQERKY